MSKIIISEMSYHYLKYYNPIFSGVNLTIDTNWKLGLIGRNGRGKTTLLKLIQGELQPDKGQIVKSIDVEYFPYNNSSTYITTIDVIKENIGGLKTMENRMDEIIQHEDKESFHEYMEILDKYINIHGFEMEAMIKKELQLMNLDEELLDRDFCLLSGGERTKMMIIALFLKNNAFIVLDEPTDHLDSEGKSNIIEYLKKKKGFIVVSHDKTLLDESVDHILSINKSNISLEKGNYSTWKKNSDMKETFEFRTKAKLEREIASLENNAGEKRKWANIAEETKNNHDKFERSSGSRGAQFMKHAKRCEEQANKSLKYKKNLLKNYEQVQELDIKESIQEEGFLIQVKNLTFGYGKKLLFNKVSLEISRGDCIWLRGGNGAGKSTLLKIISGDIKVENIFKADDLGISQVFQEPLWQKGLVKEYIEEKKTMESFLRICSILDLDEKMLKRPIETLSKGEQRKVDVARALTKESSMLLLDEPLNYMDRLFREQLERALEQYTGTMIFVEHEEEFGQNLANRIISIDRETKGLII